MPREVLMSTLVLRAQQHANMQNDPSIDPTEWNALVSEAYGEAYEIIADEGNRYFEYTTTLVTDGVTNYLPEPDDQLAVVDDLELILDASTGKCRRLRWIQPQERAAYAGRIGMPYAVELVDGRYFLYPTPPGGLSLTLRYIAQCPDLTEYAGGAIVDCYCVAGQKFVQYAAAIDAIEKSKNDASALLPKLELQRERLTNWASNRFMQQLPVWYVEDGDTGDILPANWSV